MSKAKTPRKRLPFDAARYLTDDAAVAEYMTAVLETNDPDLLLLALGDIARARGKAQAGPGRESPYKALAPGAKPRRYRANGSAGAGCSPRGASRVARHTTMRSDPNIDTTTAAGVSQRD